MQHNNNFGKSEDKNTIKTLLLSEKQTKFDLVNPSANVASDLAETEALKAIFQENCERQNWHIRQPQFPDTENLLAPKNRAFEGRTGGGENFAD